LGAFAVVFVEDLAARTGSICMGLAREQPVARKHAVDFQLLAAWVDLGLVEVAWRDHRRPDDPSSFAEAHERIRELIESRGDLLVTPTYSQDVEAVCPKCKEMGRWRLAPKPTIVSTLGYC
jgi:hypothetical protein